MPAPNLKIGSILILFAIAVAAAQEPGSALVSSAPTDAESGAYVNVKNHSTGDICVSAYVFAGSPWPSGPSPSAVCSTLIPAGRTYSASVPLDLMANLLVPVPPVPVANLKLLASTPISGSWGPCSPAFVASEALSPAITASVSPVPGSTGVPFQPLDLDAPGFFPTLPDLNEFESLVQMAAFIIGNGSGYGICPPFREIQLRPSEAVEALIEHIESLDLDPAVVNSLTASLKQAAEHLEDGNSNNDAAACGKLKAFLNAVDARRKQGELSAAQAEELTQRAEAIRSQLGC